MIKMLGPAVNTDLKRGATIPAFQKGLPTRLAYRNTVTRWMLRAHATEMAINGPYSRKLARAPGIM